MGQGSTVWTNLLFNPGAWNSFIRHYSQFPEHPWWKKRFPLHCASPEEGEPGPGAGWDWRRLLLGKES